MASTNINPELKSMSDEDLRNELAASEMEYQKNNFEHAVKGLANPLELRVMRRDIARVQTEIRSREVSAMTPEQVAKRSKIRERRSRKS